MSKSTLAAVSSMFAGLLLLGSVAGLLVGLSESPVVGAILPLLFALLGGAGGFFVLKTDFSEAGPMRGLLVYGAALACISIGVGAGVLVGMGQRAEPRGWSLLDDEPGAGLLPADAKNEGALAWVLLDARLHLIGLDAGERRKLLARIELDEGPALDVHGRLAGMADTLEEVMPAPGQVARHEEWTGVLAELRRLQVVTEDATPSGTTALAPWVRQLGESLVFLSDDEDDVAFLAARPDAAEVVERVQRDVIRVALELGSHGSVVVDAMNEQLDAFLGGDGDRAEALRVGRHLAGTESQGSTADS